MPCFLYKILEKPAVNDLVQRILSIGRKQAYEETENIIRKHAKGLILDVGCGTGRYSHLFEENLVGLDISSAYLLSIMSDKNNYVCSSCAAMPLKEDVFDFAFCVGLFHHIDDNLFDKTLSEFIRCVKKESIILIIEPLFPDKKIDLIGWLFGKLDRGKYYRTPLHFRRLIRNKKMLTLIEEGHIKRSYPYNLRYFVLKNTQ